MLCTLSLFFTDILRYVFMYFCHFSPTANRHMLRALAQAGGGAYEFFDTKTQHNWTEKVRLIIGASCLLKIPNIYSTLLVQIQIVSLISIGWIVKKFCTNVHVLFRTIVVGYDICFGHRWHLRWSAWRPLAAVQCQWSGSSSTQQCPLLCKLPSSSMLCSMTVTLWSMALCRTALRYAFYVHYKLNYCFVLFFLWCLQIFSSVDIILNFS